MNIFYRELDLLSLRIKRDIEDKCNLANAYLDLKINKEYSEANIDQIDIVSSLLKRKGYSKNGNIYTKDFVYIKVESKESIKSIHIKHDIPKIKSGINIIGESYLTSLVIALDYYERI